MDDPIKNYHNDVKKSKLRKELKLTRWQFNKYKLFLIELPKKSKKELGIMLACGYKGVFHKATMREYLKRVQEENKKSKD